jgi:hypothetical protein
MVFGIERVYNAIEAKDNYYKIRIDMENLRAVYSNLINLLGDNLDISFNTIKFAFKVLLKNFSVWMDNWNGNDQLDKIESIFINFTNLQSELHTSGIENKDLKAFAYYGLHAIEFIRGEYDPSLKNILLAYITNPRMARYKLCYDVFEFCFYPLISDDLKMDFITNNKENRYIEDRNISVYLMRNMSDLRRYRLEEIEQKIDKQCVYIAELALNEIMDRTALL